MFIGVTHQHLSAISTTRVKILNLDLVDIHLPVAIATAHGDSGDFEDDLRRHTFGVGAVHVRACEKRVTEPHLIITKARAKKIGLRQDCSLFVSILYTLARLSNT